MQFRTLIAALRTRSGIFACLGLLVLFLRILAGWMPNVVESVYSKGFFVGVRYLLDYTIGWCPFPFSYLLIIGIIAYWIRKVVRNRRQPKLPIKKRLQKAATNIFGFAGAALFFFFVLWGFNYKRVPIEQHLGLQLDSLDVETLCLEAEWAGRLAELDRASIPGITADSVNREMLPANLEDEVRTCVGKAMAKMGYPMHGRIRGRMIQPGGWMLRIGISGIYNPFTGEGNVTGAQTPQKIPFTMAHEMSHACGFGDEGTCNFIGMVACGLSDDPFVRYSGQIGYWGHLVNALGEVDPLMSKMLVATMDPGIKADLKANYNNYQRYHGKISELGNKVNNAYLNAQGVQGGIKSYDRVVVLRAAWRRKTGN
ncbi:MAG: DUF3810 domain-containing protein [Bacteroidetes bacterium]|nr:DUF3810 domain-containing protein [Bacteroidota bacterium]MBP6721470.1 DUF3810 domain-containing protein [Bacteroidia bacterium]